MFGEDGPDFLLEEFGLLDGGLGSDRTLTQSRCDESQGEEMAEKTTPIPFSRLSTILVPVNGVRQAASVGHARLQIA
jgi:hypothetical protein